MKMKEVCKRTSLTDRAVRYYIENGLLQPHTDHNYMGRRAFDFSEEDVQILQKISLLRKASFSVEEIGNLLSGADTYTIVQNRVVLLEEELRQGICTKAVLEQALTVSELSCERLVEILEKPQTMVNQVKNPDLIRLGKIDTVLILAAAPFLSLLFWFLTDLEFDHFCTFIPMLACICLPSLLEVARKKEEHHAFGLCIGIFLYAFYLAVFELGIIMLFTYFAYGSTYFSFMFYDPMQCVFYAAYQLAPGLFGGAISTALLLGKRKKGIRLVLSLITTLVLTLFFFILVWSLIEYTYAFLFFSAILLVAVAYLLYRQFEKEDQQE